MEHAGRPNVDRSAAKKYFKGAGLIPLILIGTGLFFGLGGIAVIAMAIIGLILIAAGAVWIFAGKMAAEAYERQVDEIIAGEQEFLIQRGANKLGLVEQHTGLIEPIKTIGMGTQPSLILEAKGGGKGLFAGFKSLMKAAAQSPILVTRVDKNGKWRYSLIQANIFMFGETQLYIYCANVDITTGLIFQEETHEYFYRDVCGITTEQRLESKLNAKTRKVQNVVIEFIKIYTPGCSHSAIIDTSIGSASVLDQQFAAMRNLVREKREEK